MKQETPMMWKYRAWKVRLDNNLKVDGVEGYFMSRYDEFEELAPTVYYESAKFLKLDPSHYVWVESIEYQGVATGFENA